MRLARISAVLITPPDQCGDQSDARGDVTMELVACLTHDARLDAAGTQRTAEYCRARRFRNGVEEWSGTLMQTQGGWVLRSDRGEDEPLWPIAANFLRPGEYLTLGRPDGRPSTFRIVNVDG